MGRERERMIHRTPTPQNNHSLPSKKIHAGSILTLILFSTKTCKRQLPIRKDTHTGYLFYTKEGKSSSKNIQKYRVIPSEVQSLNRKMHISTFHNIQHWHVFSFFHVQNDKSLSTSKTKKLYIDKVRKELLVQSLLNTMLPWREWLHKCNMKYSVIGPTKAIETKQHSTISLREE